MIVNTVCVEVRQDIEKILEKGPQLGCRHIQMVLYFLLMTYTYCMRSVLSVAIVAMNDNSTSVNKNIPSYNWTNRSIVLSSFYWGYILFQIPAAYLGKKLGIKWILIWSTTLDSVACMLIPVVAERFGSTGVMICRFFQGVGQGFNLPLVNMLLGHWAPPSERSRIGTFAYAGSVFGNIISLPITGFICSSSVGWPISFYLWGCFGLSWVVIWSLFGYDRPSSHSKISTEEMNYIESSLGQCARKNHKTPWKDILKSRPAWAILFANMGVNWGSAIMSTQIPTFLDKVLAFDIQKNALLSAAPYLAMWISSFLFSTVCDIIINKELVTRGTARKIFNSIGSFGPAIGLTAIGFFNKDQADLSVAMLILVGGTTAAGYCGFQINHLDLSPNHSGMLIGLTNGLTSIFSVISPHSVHYVVTDQTNPKQWRLMFLMAAAVYAITDLFYIIFASGEVQPWNEKFDETSSENENIESQNNDNNLKNKENSNDRHSAQKVDKKRSKNIFNSIVVRRHSNIGIDNSSFKNDSDLSKIVFVPESSRQEISRRAEIG